MQCLGPPGVASARSAVDRAARMQAPEVRVQPSPAQALVIGLIGLTAGLLGGLAGIGGSLIMLPALALLLHDPQPSSAQHLYMAAAMCVNFLVAAPATARHHRAGVLRPDLVRALVPAMVVAIVLGVLLSNQIEGLRLRQALAAFIAAYSALNLLNLVWPIALRASQAEHAPATRLSLIGLVTGTVAGLLGIGGGVVLVPALQVVCRLQIRLAIAASSAAMCFSSLIGAAVKLGTLGQHGRSVAAAAILVVLMGPLAVAGALVGATLVHRLPVRVIRAVVSVALLAAAARLAGLL